MAASSTEKISAIHTLTTDALWHGLDWFGIAAPAIQKYGGAHPSGQQSHKLGAIHNLAVTMSSMGDVDWTHKRRLSIREQETPPRTAESGRLLAAASFPQRPAPQKPTRPPRAHPDQQAGAVGSSQAQADKA
jgi:hypothetical protein